MKMYPVLHYVRELRPSLPDTAFAPARSRLLWLPLQLAVVTISIVTIARGWLPWPLLPLLSLVIGASFGGLTFLAHETMHGAVVRHAGLRRLIGFIGFLPFALSPRLWTVWHNRVHHGHANIPGVDPDAYPTIEQYRAERKVRIVTDYFAPGRERLAGLLAFTVGFTVQSVHMLVASRSRGWLTARGQRVAMVETGLAVAIWTALAVVIGLPAFLLAFGLPLVVANIIIMAFIFTNHSLSPVGNVNDPLANSLSVTLPRWLEWLTLRFGFHVEHHLFPSMSSRHAHLVREQLRARWPERYQSMPFGRALLLLHRTGRIYQDGTLLVDPHGGTSLPALQPTRTEAA